jgi:hypothetical protein
MRHRIAPDGDAEDLARRMMGNDDVQREILSETLDSAANGQIKESGRTVCGGGSSIKGPLGRYPTSVELDSCPRGRGGTWHTHVTPDEIRSPQNSLPDMANVIYGYLDASVVVGTDTSEAFIRSANPEAAKAAFEESIGAGVSGAGDVTNAVMSGDVNPTAARRRVRSNLSPLFIERPNGYSDMGSRVPDRVNLAAPDGLELREAKMYHPDFSGGPTGRVSSVQQMNDTMDEAGKKAIAAASGIDEESPLGNLRNLAISSAVGTVVGEFVTRTLFE